MLFTSYYIITNCRGDKPPGELDLSFTNCCWQTAARAPGGTPLFPDGDYLIAVTAFDSHENQSTQSMKVTVDNAGKRPLAFAARQPKSLPAPPMSATGKRL